MSQHKKATLKEVAAKADVSIATVSRVLNQTNYVSPEVEKSVRDAIEELGYYQNFIARSLKTNSTNTIAFITADISNPYMITVAKAIEDLIHARKYNLMVCSTGSDPKRELEHLMLQMGRNIDGLVINATGLNEEFVAEISKRIPVILIHRRNNHPGFKGDLVDSDNEDGTYGLTKHLITFGHRRIYVIKGNRFASNNADRFRGFCKAMEEIGITVDENYPYQFDGNFKEESGYRAIGHLCGLPAKPTAVLGLNNTMTIGALRGLMNSSVSVPEEMSVASYNNIQYKELMLIRPTVHNVDPREIGLIAGRALLERIADAGIPNRELVLKGQMMPGNAVSAPMDASVPSKAEIIIKKQEK